MLLLKVQELASRQEPASLQGTLDLTDFFRDNPEFRPLGPMRYELKAEAADDRILVSGRLSCEVRVRCSRCLNEVDETIEVPFGEQFRVVGGENAASNDEEDEAVPVTEERIDLAPYLAEDYVVQLPYAPLCSEACRGLCPECGTNLNEQSCGCRTEKIDPRMAALQDWFKSQKE
ncbi:YceD family protein [Paenibacillaceae bacterium WGS1546]|uniref:YceD family protein n=1 Tax=Cohnella sp. WGS1546 TaxID=3366810 RepID=UPI00372D7E40